MVLFSRCVATAALSLFAIIQPVDSACTNPVKRQEWSSVTQPERDQYIRAVKCLATKPSRLNLTTTLYDDFPYIHDKVFSEIHITGNEAVAVFLPWHRYFLYLYERALNDCGYSGTMMYWDWTKDSSDPMKAAIWDPITGIGGDGVQSNTCQYITGLPQQCVASGPFASLRPAYHNGRRAPHSISRCFTCDSPTMDSWMYTPSAVAQTLAVPKYQDFTSALYFGSHIGIHEGVGGDLPASNSPNDPVFAFHHTQVDRLWWKWQQNNPAARTNAYEGPRYSIKNPSITTSTLSDLMNMAGLATDLPVSSVMSTQSDLLCYTY
ncbi:hypothetical protein B0J14DRAFT_553656 [Halenospora varia]|nr:hypothetical protein B0J14DRAFT_553656 [Halenospora varia]